MSTQTRKKTVAQLRADNEQRQKDEYIGVRLANDLQAVMKHLASVGIATDIQYEKCTGLVGQANRVCELLQPHIFRPDGYLFTYGAMLRHEAIFHRVLGLHALAIAVCRQADDIFAEGERKGYSRQLTITSGSKPLLRWVCITCPRTS